MGNVIKGQRRVAAYCRVDTGSEAANSRKATEDYYAAKAADTPEWTLVQVFTDERGTRTSPEKRKGFRKMLQLCRKGEIDLILTRSLTSFSRTICEGRKAIQELQALNIPVIFEKEGLDTSSPEAETFANLYAVLAKAESESLPHHICNKYPMLMPKGGPHK